MLASKNELLTVENMALAALNESLTAELEAYHYAKGQVDVLQALVHLQAEMIQELMALKGLEAQ